MRVHSGVCPSLGSFPEHQKHMWRSRERQLTQGGGRQPGKRFPDGENPKCGPFPNREEEEERGGQPWSPHLSGCSQLCHTQCCLLSLHLTNLLSIMPGQKLWNTESESRQISLALVSLLNGSALPDGSVQLLAFCLGWGDRRYVRNLGGRLWAYLSLHDRGGCS